MHDEQEIWYPNPKQITALQSSCYETLYGGARGGGKTDAGIVWCLKEVQNPRLRALVIRRNSDDLSDWMDRASRLYRAYGAIKTGNPGVIRFPSGALIRTGHLKDDQAYTKYQGHEYQRILIEEVTQIPDETRYLQLLGSCRSTLPGLDARVFLTTNPGGVGHGWVKRRFIEPCQPGTIYPDPISGRTRVFIGAKVEDTPQLTQADPGYVQFLEGLKGTNVELWKAWRLGDWNTFAGQFFQEFRTELHVIPPFFPHKDYIFVGGMDWGRTAPFAFELSTVEKCEVEGLKFFRCKTFLEVYGTDKTPKEWSIEIKGRLKDFGLTLNDIDWIRGDPAMYTKGNDNSISIADQFKENGVNIKPASNERIGGWTNIHEWLSIAPDKLPFWQITSNCINLIRTLPELVHDENKVEDTDSSGEDHAPDAVRYQFKHLKRPGAFIGGVLEDQKEQVRTKFFMPKTDDGKQISININRFTR